MKLCAFTRIDSPVVSRLTAHRDDTPSNERSVTELPDSSGRETKPEIPHSQLRQSAGALLKQRHSISTRCLLLYLSTQPCVYTFYFFYFFYRDQIVLLSNLFSVKGVLPILS